jgi:lysophospholipase L1-like esterase
VSRAEKKSWAPSWAALSAAALLVAAASFARCGGNSEPPRPARPPAPSAAPPAAAASVQAPPAPEAAAPAPAPAPAEPRRYVVAAIGDSLTDQSSGGGKYLQLLRKRCPESQFYNHGKGGDMVNQMRRRFFRDVLPALAARRTTHLIVFGGVNDLYSDLTAGRTPEKVSKDLAAMFAAARERGVKIVAITVAPWGGFERYYNPRRGQATLELNAWLQAEHARGQIDHVVDAYALLSCGDPERLCPEVALPYKDGLHFGPVGHEKLGEALYAAVFNDCR